MSSKVIFKNIRSDEELKKFFSISQRYLKIRVALITAVLLLFITPITWGLLSGNKNNKHSPVNYTIEIIGAALIIFLILTLINLFYNFFYLKIANEYALTNKKIIVKKGWLGLQIKSIPYEKITDLRISQPIIERVLGIGSIFVNTAGSDKYEGVIWRIDNPYELKQNIEEFKEELEKGKKENAKNE